MSNRPTFFYPAARTPVVETRALPAGHKPLSSVLVDGVNVTRELAIYTVKLGREEAEKMPEAQRENFVREMLASANHDLLLGGYALISEDEIINDANPLELVAAPERVAALREILTQSFKKALP